MAEIDDLLDQVKQPEVRERLADAVRDLKRDRKFGLVYERHIPETVALTGLSIEEGSLVQLRTHPGDPRQFQVTEVTDDGVSISSVNGDHEELTIDESDLRVVRRVGEPIFPTLEPFSRVERSEDRPFHVVIDGENHHALQLLLLLHEKQVDCIYIDPPYNTGARDWKYNNHFVDRNDSWRHSKWLSMMERRLRLAKRLLKPDGVLICTIDEHEVNHLGVLLEQLFPEFLRYLVTIVTNPKGNFKNNFARVEEYAFFCCPNTGEDVVLGAPIDYMPEHDDIEIDSDQEEAVDESVAEVQLQNAEETEYEWQHARRRGNNSLRKDRKNLFYPVFIDEGKRIVVSTGPPLELDEERDSSPIDGLRPIWPIDTAGKERTWRLSWTTMQAEIDAGNVRLGNYNDELDSWTINLKRPKKTFKKVKTVWRHKSHDAGTHGTTLLAKLLGQPRLFSFPKSVYAVRDTIATVVRSRPNALVVDFFAGSGTTLHATALLNDEDLGSRRCILVTNNEVEESVAKRLNQEGHFPGDPEFEAEGIFEKVAVPRITAALEGRTPIGDPVQGTYIGGKQHAEGFEENVQFFKLKYLDRDDIDLGLCFEDLLPVLWLQTGAAGPLPEAGGGSKWYVAENSALAVLFDEVQFREFAAELEKRPDITHVFLATDSPEAYSEMRAGLGSSVSASMLYRDYLRHFLVNARAAE